MKRFLILLISALLSITLFAACSAPSQESAEPSPAESASASDPDSASEPASASASASPSEQPAVSGEERQASLEQKAEENKPQEEEPGFGTIAIDDFAKVQLVTAKVTACERVPKSDKLLKETLDVGGETRTVLSGIAQWYTPEEMVGKTVVLVKNLAPRKMRGVVSEGMLLCASDKDGNLKLVTVEGGDFAPGAEIG